MFALWNTGGVLLNIDCVYKELTERIDRARLIKKAPMKEYTSFRAGGNAALLVIPSDIGQLKYALKTLSAYGIDYFIMGNGTNLLVKDGGYRGAIVRIGSDISGIEVNGDRIKAEAGALLSAVAAKALEHSLAGIEFASGIPGSLGGAVFMNAGAYEGEIGRVVETVQAVSKDGSKEYTLTAAEMQYGYRSSILMKNGALVISATLKLEYGEYDAIASRMKELNAKRTQKQPLQYPSAGSFFKRPEGNFAGKLIQDANLKGLSLGGARVSPLHAGFIINEGGATASDIINLMKVVQNTVYDQSGVMLEPEVRIIGDDPEVI